MSISTKLEQFKNTTRIVLNDKFIGDQGASQLANFLSHHKGTTCLQIKSNDITSQGFLPIFQSLLSSSNQTLKQLNFQYNNLGVNDYVQWHDLLSQLISSCPKLQRINVSNNKITSEGFLNIMEAIASSTSLKLIQLRYNNIGNQTIEQFVRKLKNFNNQVLLYVELVGNKIKRQVLDGLEAILSKNRSKNPITKQKLMGIAGTADAPSIDADRTHTTVNRSNTVVDQIPYTEMTRYMQQILDQNRRQTSQNKIRLQKQLAELQKRQRIDAADLNDLQKRCNQLVIVNRNLKFELDRTLGQYQQIQRDDQSHLRAHEQKIKQTTKQVQDLQQKYEQIENRMNKEHELKMKQIVRDWESRLRSVEQKVRHTENQNSLIENQIRKNMDKRERLRIQLVEEQNSVRTRLNEQESHRFNFKVKQLESKLRIAQSARDGYIRRNEELVYQLQKSNTQNNRQIQELEQQLNELKVKQSEFNAKSKDFFTKNQKIKADTQMKQISIDRLEDQISRLDKQIETKRAAGEDEHAKLKQDHQYAKLTRQSQKQSRLDRLSQVQNSLRLAQIENAKLRQQYGLLAQKLQVNLNLAVHKVFEENQLY